LAVKAFLANARLLDELARSAPHAKAIITGNGKKSALKPHPATAHFQILPRGDLY